ncbi:hypothetical protein GOHSU_03_00090 [Gordonia hirsuta DSM 44140 = NBRC 16056]|uniref:Uncharacterized protein n=1 Tax=Gordonia hirsuta DSM 44140 = NBRC 16056 TaxID=1121927 RepID=L7L4P6_9ACTN|nr:hypothetical protein [Gordonia hirsuta]GAC56115.1 hypothetical protein GOHSU_03_00090 [Gordonia hirsuta DSM 44140 = NBRC 16056]
MLGALLLVGALILLLVDVLTPAPRADVAALGPVVQTIPDAAVTAVLAVQFRDLSQKSHHWDGDDSWLVFLDEQNRPIGHVGGTGMLQGRIAAAGDTLAFAQPESFRIISGSRSPLELPHPNDYAVAASSSVAGSDREAFLWTGYGPAHGLRIGHQRQPTRVNRPGPVVAAGYCGDDYYLATGQGGADGGSRVVLERVSPGGDFEPVTSWAGSAPLAGGALPISCTDSRIRVPLHDDKDGRPASVDGHGSGVIGFREVEVTTGASRWVPAATPVIDDRLGTALSVAGGSAAAHVGADGVVTYLDRDDRLQRLDPAATRPFTGARLVRSESERLEAATLIDASRAVLAVTEHAGGADVPILATYDLATGDQLDRTRLDWLTGTALGPFGATVTDIAVLSRH